MKKTLHAIRCKKTGEAVALKLDGGECACPSAEVCPVPLKEAMDEIAARERFETLLDELSRTPIKAST